MPTIRPRQKRGRDGRLTTVFHVQVRMSGYPSRTGTFPTERMAERWAKTVEAEMIEGRHFRNAQSRRRTVREAIDKYIAEVLPAKKDTKNPLGRLKWWNDRIGKVTLADLTSEVIDDQLTKLLREPYTRAKPDTPGSTVSGAPRTYKRSRNTANRYSAALSRVMTIARKRWKWLSHDPFSGIERENEGKGRTNILTRDELERLLAATDADKSPDGRLLDLLVRMAISSTARAGELKKLRWRHVDLEDGRLYFGDTKNQGERVAFVRGAALERLRDHKARADLSGHGGLDDHVFRSNRFAGKLFSYTKPLGEAAKAAGVKHTVFHILRHISATELAKAGATEQQLKAIGGWKSNVVARYVHMAAEDAKNIVDKMNDKVLGNSDAHGAKK